MRIHFLQHFEVYFLWPMLVDVAEDHCLDPIRVKVGLIKLVLNLFFKIVHPSDPAVLERNPQSFFVYLFLLE